MTRQGVVVHVVDDDEPVRTALSRLLRAESLEVRTYGSAREFVGRGNDGKGGCVVLDLNMPGIGGLDLLDTLRRDPDALPVLFLTGYGDIPASVRAMKAGAVDFLTKPVDRDRLLAAVETALARDAEQRRHRDQLRTIQSRFDELTPREREVFDLLVTGMLNKEVGAALGTTERTVKAHRAQIMSKLKVKSVAELVHVATTLGRAAGGS
jgi:RNA polymerase sigma factor (sigma-70 family)